MTDATRRPIRRALISVYDKTDLVELARALVDAGVEIVSTGSTARTIADAGLPVTPVEQLTGFPECLDGRVKTLHPKVHAGLLADLRLESHRDQLAELGVQPFDVLVSNLYPFTATVASGASPDECVEQIDIGGPAMVRSSAKNHASVAVITEPGQYDQLRAALAEAVSRWLSGRCWPRPRSPTRRPTTSPWRTGCIGRSPAPGSGDFPSWAGAAWRRADVLRYGENPHQPAALYLDEARPGGLAAARQLHGKQMSYNNYVDADAARRTAYDFAEPAVAIIKHANPCGVAVGADIAEAHQRAHACDPVSAFGGVIATNRPVSVALAGQIAEVFTEVVVAPGVRRGSRRDPGGEEEHPAARGRPAGGDRGGPALDRRRRAGAVPGPDRRRPRPALGLAAGGGGAVSAERLADLEFAWRAVRGVKSNAILLAHDGPRWASGWVRSTGWTPAGWRCSGPGTGSPGTVAASDAFFPFADGPEILLAAGVSAIVQPGGSVRDDEVIAAVAGPAGATMYFTGARHFFH